MEYSVIKKLASGGMADLFLAVQTNQSNLSRACVLKTIRKEDDGREDLERMLSEEMQFLLKLQNSAIVQFLDVIRHNDSPSIVMEYVAGVDLERATEIFRDQRVQIPPAMAFHITLRIAEALHFIHTYSDPLTGQSLNIIHRDISPGNILLSFNGEVKLSDFGVAKGQIENRQETSVGIIKGKLSYMSPEQKRGEPLDFRTDLYSFGILFYELFMGERFKQEDDDTHASQRVWNFDEKFGNGAAGILQLCLAEDREKRYSSTLDLVNDLNDYISKNCAAFGAKDLSAFLKAALVEDYKICQDNIRQIAQISEQLKGKKIESSSTVSVAQFSDVAAPAPNTQVRNQIRLSKEEEQQRELNRSNSLYYETHRGKDLSLDDGVPQRPSQTPTKLPTNANLRINTEKTNYYHKKDGQRQVPAFIGLLVIGGIAYGIYKYYLKLKYG